MPRPGVPYEVLKRSLDKQSVGLVSYQQYGEQLHVVALSSYGQVSMALSGKASKAQANIAAHMSDLLGGKLDNGEQTLAEKDAKQYGLSGDTKSSGRSDTETIVRAGPIDRFEF